MNFKYVLPIVKRKLQIDLQRQCRVQKLCHAGKENSLAIAVHSLLANQQQVNQAVLGSSKEKQYFPFNLPLYPSVWRPHCCAQPKRSHSTSKHAGSPVLQLDRHLLEITGGRKGVTGITVTIEVQVAQHIIKVYGSSLANSKYIY